MFTFQSSKDIFQYIFVVIQRCYFRQKNQAKKKKERKNKPNCIQRERARFLNLDPCE